MTARVAERIAWLVGCVGVLSSVLTWLVAPTVFPHAWLAALTCWLGWPLGSMALVFIHALTGGRWGGAVRPQLASAIATMPLVLPALLPLMLVLPTLYPWMRPEAAAGLGNRFYLNAPFFFGRCAVYLIIWLGLAAVLRWTLRRSHPERLLIRLAPAGLILLGLSVTFAAIDFTLSLDPHFESSVYGLLVASEDVLFALSIAVLGVTLARSGKAEDTHDLGKLVFALVLLWAYLDFMQLLIVWNSNLPDEARWYRPRLLGVWAAVAGVVAALHFVLPCVALLWPQVQRSRHRLRTLTALLVITEVPRAWWTVIPAAGRPLSVWDAAPMAAMLGVASGIALRALRTDHASPVAAVAARG